MNKISTLFYFIIFLSFLLEFISCDYGGIDLSDRNPIVFCLKEIKKFTFEQVKDYLLRNQDPEFAIENSIHDDLFSLCVEHIAKDNN